MLPALETAQARWRRTVAEVRKGQFVVADSAEQLGQDGPFSLHPVDEQGLCQLVGNQGLEARRACSEGSP